MSTALPASRLRNDRLASLAAVVALHAAAGAALIIFAKPMIQQILAEPIRIELVSAAAPALQKERPKPLPPQVQKQVQPRHVPTPVAAPLIQTAAPTPLNETPIETPPAPKAAPTATLSDTTPQSRATPTSPATPAAEAVQAPRFDADYLHNPAPAYPSASRSLNEEGRVILRVQVGADGRAQQVLVETGSGYPRLDRAAREAVANWRFVPARQGQQAIAGWVKVPIVFELKS